jgi:hypothetical protein
MTTSSWAIGELEPVLHDLYGTVGLLGHMCSSPDMKTPQELAQIHDRLFHLHDKLERLWHTAWDQWSVTAQNHAEALAAAKAEKAAPGSPADIKAAKASWRVLRVVMENALACAREAEEQHATAAVEVKKW